MAKQKLEGSEENLDLFTSIAPDLKRRDERQLVDELYKKNWQQKTVDAFEARVGIAPSKGSDKQTLNYKNRLFEPSYDKDQQLLNELMNSPKYKIIYLKDNWSPDGAYKLFIIYAEIMDEKSTDK